MSETLESLRGSFNRSLRVEGKVERTLVLYGQWSLRTSAAPLCAVPMPCLHWLQ